MITAGKFDRPVLTIRDVPADGACMFSAAACVLQLRRGDTPSSDVTQLMSNDLRKIVSAEVN